MYLAAASNKPSSALRHSCALGAFLFLLLIGGFSGTTFAQNARIVHKITKQKMTVGPAMGRDLWFTMAKNYDDQAGKYYMLYVTSPNNTNVHVQLTGGSIYNVPVQAYKVGTFNINLGWEVKTSGVVEDKAIRVWSDDADITAYLMSHNPYTSDGMYIVPTIGWGTDYVVAAYHSLFELVWDYPSEFVVISNQNNTQVEVTPIQDIRGSDPNTALHPKGQKFMEVLNRGQVVQYQLTQAQSADEYDVTGTIIHSNNPVGVVGASQCPNIPPDYPYCDHICDMLPPIRTWAKNYYSAPFIKRKGGDTFLLIGTEAGQKIYRWGPTTGEHLFCVIDSKYGYYWNPSVDEASHWHSDKPFLCVQYINSATWPDGANGDGDPAMVVVNAVEQYTPRVIFETPRSVGNQSPYTNYANVIVSVPAEPTTLFDGKKITGYPKIALDGKYDIYRVGNLTPAAHEVKSDSGVGVYIYGYGYDESYAWTGALGTRTFDSPDTIPPVALTSGQCFQAHVHFDDVHLNASKLNLMRVDTSYNMSFIEDPDWIEGTGRDSTYYDIFVLDPTQPASITVTAIDLAGNVTTVKSDYIPQTASITPPAQNFGTGNIGGPAIIRYDTITNTGQKDFDFTELKLLRGSVGFHIDSADMSPLKVGETRIFKISFVPISGSTVGDTVKFGDPCGVQKVVLIGSGGQPDFYVTDYDWGKRPVGVPVTAPSPIAKGGVSVVNPTPSTLRIDSIFVDSAQFVVDPTFKVPFLVPGNGQTTVPMIFTANYANIPIVSGGHFWGSSANDLTSQNVTSLGVRDDSLRGIGIAPGQIFRSDTSVSQTCVLGDTMHLAFYVQATGDVATNVVRLSHSQAGNPMWANLQATDQANSPVDPNNKPVQLNNGMRMLVYLDFVPPTNQSGVFTDNITAYTTQDNGAGGFDTVPIKTITATVTLHYTELTASNTNLDFGTQTYGAPKTPDQLIAITNTSTEVARFDSIGFRPGSKNPASFKITGYDLNGVATSVPVLMNPNDVVHIHVAFDPAVSVSDSQSAVLVVFDSGVCNFIDFPTAIGRVKSGGAWIQGYQSSPILACGNEQGTITIGNPQAAGLTETIDSYTITGPNAANFSVPNLVGMTIGGQSSITTTATFAPNPIPGVTNYSADLTVYLHGPLSVDTVILPLTGTGISVRATTAANLMTKAESASGTVTMPIDASVDMGGLTSPLQTMRISTVRLTFDLNTDLLSIAGTNPNDPVATAAAIANAVTGLPLGWTVDQASTTLTNGKMVLTLRNPNFLDATVKSFGQIKFDVTLPGVDTTRNVTLESMQLFTEDNQGNLIAVEPGCVSTSVASSDFTLVYLCGDTTLQQLMNGNTTFLQIMRPATPNPATSSITFHYGSKIEQPITISIFDALGNQVARIMDNMDQQAGQYEVSYNVSSLPSGTYTYRIEGRRTVVSKQFIVTH